MDDKDLLIPEGEPITAEQMAAELNLDVFDRPVNDLTRIILTNELNRALSEPGVSRELLRLIGASRSGPNS
mgnify:CR=1 FL=1